MSAARALFCAAPADPPRFFVGDVPVRRPGKGEVLVEQLASAINPIDAKRAAGYGARLLALRGAGRFPLVPGNDVVGVVRECGPGVSGLAVGSRVVGLLPTGPSGAHATRVTVPAQWLREAPAGASAEELAALPYSFTTMWLALRSCGLDAATARGRTVLVNGAGGGLGRMALHVLRGWGAEVTAVDSEQVLPACAALGARELVPRGPQAVRQLAPSFAAVLNFGSWDDDALLTSRLGRNALGHGTTVHPLLAQVDAHGLLRGGLRSWEARRMGRQRVASRAPGARYAWVVFRPDGEALDAMLAAWGQGLRLPVGWTGSLEDAPAGFAHVRAGAPGRAVLRLAVSAGGPPPFEESSIEAVESLVSSR